MFKATERPEPNEEKHQVKTLPQDVKKYQVDRKPKFDTFGNTVVHLYVHRAFTNLPNLSISVIWVTSCIVIRKMSYKIGLPNLLLQSIFVGVKKH